MYHTNRCTSPTLAWRIGELRAQADAALQRHPLCYTSPPRYSPVPSSPISQDLELRRQLLDAEQRIMELESQLRVERSRRLAVEDQLASAMRQLRYERGLSKHQTGTGFQTSTPLCTMRNDAPPSFAPWRVRHESLAPENAVVSQPVIKDELFSSAPKEETHTKQNKDKKEKKNKGKQKEEEGQKMKKEKNGKAEKKKKEDELPPKPKQKEKKAKKAVSKNKKKEKQERERKSSSSSSSTSSSSSSSSSSESSSHSNPKQDESHRQPPQLQVPADSVRLALQSPDTVEKMSAFRFGSASPTGDSGLNGEGSAFAQADDSERHDSPAGARGERRRVVSSEVVDRDTAQSFAPTLYPKDDDLRGTLTGIMQEIVPFRHLDDREIRVAVDAMQPFSFAAGDTVTIEGQQTDMFHVIASGQCVQTMAGGTVRRELGPGDYFGELEVMCNHPNVATVVAETPTCTWALERETYRYLMAGTFIKKRALHMASLRKVGFLRSLADSELLQLADALEPHIFQPGEVIIHYDEQGMWFYLIFEGTVEVIGRDSEGNRFKVCEFGEGDCVGELELLNNHKTVADVVAKTEVRTAKLNRPHFELCLGPIKEILSRSRDTDPVFDYYHQIQRGGLFLPAE
eukprot:TRINITY_DN16237_c0_g1_i1.p1 TRINITY_DN16237_c0_g1~~TRINITY_DN16237_c0_g1_i1.p1  ORF type:complete len:638 (+),score=135.12 TRINITY_DN16237_c0_g1_i1:33-1916(+)